MIIRNYAPDEIVLKVEGQNLELLAEDFLQEDEEGFYLTLLAGSASRELLVDICISGAIVSVNIEVPVEDCEGKRITDLDIEGRYTISRVGAKLGTGIPLEVFRFTNQGEFS